MKPNASYNISQTQPVPVDGLQNIALKSISSPELPGTTFGQAFDNLFEQIIQNVRAVVQAELTQYRVAPTSDAGEADKLLTPEQTAELLNICRQTVFDWAKRGLLIAHRIGRRTFFKRGEVLAALQSQQQPTGHRKYARKMR